MLVLGSHILDQFRLFAGDPVACFAHVTQNGADVRASDARTPSEPIGRVAGNQVNAVFSFANGVHGYFSSMASPDTDRMRFGVYLYGSRGVIFVPNQISPDGQPRILRSPGWMPTATAGWEPIPLTDPVPAASPLGVQHLSNVAMVRDLLDAAASGRQPMCSEIDGRWTVEMVAAVYQSHLTGRRLSLPLQDRTSGLDR